MEIKKSMLLLSRRADKTHSGRLWRQCNSCGHSMTYFSQDGRPTSGRDATALPRSVTPHLLQRGGREEEGGGRTAGDEELPKEQREHQEVRGGGKGIGEEMNTSSTVNAVLYARDATHAVAP